MMGNFLTTLGNTPDEDRAMFEGLGLNVGRHADNGANPRPDNRSGWLEGETPNVIGDALAKRTQAAPAKSEPNAELSIRLWDPSAQLRFFCVRSEPRSHDRDRGAAARAQGARPQPPHAPRQRTAGTPRPARRQARAAVVLQQLPRAGRSPAPARGRGRCRDALGRRGGRLTAGVRDDDDPPPAGGAAGRGQGAAEGAAVLVPPFSPSP